MAMETNDCTFDIQVNNSNEYESNAGGESIVSSTNTSLSKHVTSINLRRKRKSTSDVWEHYTVQENNGVKEAKCNLCGILYTNPSGISTLRKHMIKHGVFANTNGRIQSTIDLTTGTANYMKPLSEKKSQEITNALVSWVIDSMQSFSTVEKGKFVEFVQTCEPRYSPPKRTTIQRQIMERKDILLEKISQFVLSLPCKVSITTDTWSSSVLKGYLAITLHWISD